jgi:hypothetical protein
MNLVDLITSQLSGDVLGKLGGLVGASEQQTQSATSAAVPALLQIFGKLASSPKGADQLAGAMGGLDLSMLGNLAGYLGGGNASGLGRVGGDLLGSLLGGGNLTKLVGTIASFVGSQPGMMQKLLTYVAPIILGVVAKQLGGRPNGSSVSRLFSEQASNIAPDNRATGWNGEYADAKTAGAPAARSGRRKPCMGTPIRGLSGRNTATVR